MLLGAVLQIRNEFFPRAEMRQGPIHPGDGPWATLGACLLMLLMLACFLAYGAWVVWMIANGKVTYVIAL